MAVMQHSIIFGGVDSADFDLYIGGEGTFNAPERAVDIVSVPGRNGAIVIDKGHLHRYQPGSVPGYVRTEAVRLP